MSKQGINTREMLALAEQPFVMQSLRALHQKIAYEWQGKWLAYGHSLEHCIAKSRFNGFLIALEQDIAQILVRQRSLQSLQTFPNYATQTPKKNTLRSLLSKKITDIHLLQQNTKEALSCYLGYASWEDFKQNHATHETKLPPSESSTLELSDITQTELTISFLPQNLYPLAVLPNEIIVLELFYAHFFTPYTYDISQTSPWQKRVFYVMLFFACIVLKDTPPLPFIFKVVSPPCDAVPCTVQIQYQVPFLSETDTFRFYSGVNEDLRILEKPRGSIVHSYYQPKSFSPSLYLNEHKQSVIPLFIKTDRWFLKGGFKNRSDKRLSTGEENDSLLMNQGRLEVPSYWKDSLEWVSFMNVDSKLFNNVSADDCSATFRIRNHVAHGGIDAYDSHLILVGKNNKQIEVNFIGKKNYHEHTYMLAGSDTISSKKGYPMDKLSIELINWTTITMRTRQDTFSVYRDNKLCYAMPYKEKIGRLQGIIISFRGCGQVDSVSIVDHKTKRIAYANSFDSE